MFTGKKITNTVNVCSNQVRIGKKQNTNVT